MALTFSDTLIILMFFFIFIFKGATLSVENDMSTCRNSYDSLRSLNSLDNWKIYPFCFLIRTFPSIDYCTSICTCLVDQPDLDPSDYFVFLKCRSYEFYVLHVACNTSFYDRLYGEPLSSRDISLRHFSG